PGAVHRGSKGLAHRLIGSDKEIGSSLHRAATDHWLSDLPVASWQFRTSWSEGPRRTFSMDDQLAFLIPLDLRDIMRHIIDDLHAEGLGRTAEHGAERFPDPMRDHLSIRKSTVGCAVHSREVVLAFG